MLEEHYFVDGQRNLPDIPSPLASNSYCYKAQAFKPDWLFTDVISVPLCYVEGYTRRPSSWRCAGAIDPVPTITVPRSIREDRLRSPCWLGTSFVKEPPHDVTSSEIRRCFDAVPMSLPTAILLTMISTDCSDLLLVEKTTTGRWLIDMSDEENASEVASVTVVEHCAAGVAMPIHSYCVSHKNPPTCWS
jgi:hypothetical protein